MYVLYMVEMFGIVFEKVQTQGKKAISNMKKFAGSQLSPCSRVLKEKIKQTKHITDV